MNFSDLRLNLIQKAKSDIKSAIGKDHIVINAINNIEEIDKVCNSLVMRLRDWVSLINPEFESAVKDNEKFVSLFLEGNLNDSEMGAVFEDVDVNMIKLVANNVLSLYSLRNDILSYLKSVLEKFAPNLLYIAGTTISAKLLREAGSLRALAFQRSTVIQIYGAEKALFRHIKTGARPPKYGYLLAHPLVAQAKTSVRGKVARALADKISLCVRMDFFKGDFVADKVFDELKVKFGDYSGSD